MLKSIVKKVVQSKDALYNKIVFWRRSPQYLEMPKIKGKIYLVSDKKAISFGRNVRINSSLESNPIGGSVRTILFCEPGAKIEIGSNVGISNSAIHAAESIVIEDNVLLGGDCRIYDTDFHSIQYEQRIAVPDVYAKKAAVRIKKGAFIGANCMILKGVTIGEHSVIAAGSVVTKSVPSDELWGGVPAKFIKKL